MSWGLASADFDNDGAYDDGTGVNPAYSWSSPNTYTIWIKAIDSVGKNDTDSAQVTISKRNTAPNKPSTPVGQESGKTKTEYTFSSSAKDLDGDKIYLVFNWGDGTTSGWLGSFTSGTTQDYQHDRKDLPLVFRSGRAGGHAKECCGNTKAGAFPLGRRNA
jgi:PKD repeat protein